MRSTFTWFLHFPIRRHVLIYDEGLTRRLAPSWPFRYQLHYVQKFANAEDIAPRLLQWRGRTRGLSSEGKEETRRRNEMMERGRVQTKQVATGAGHAITKNLHDVISFDGWRVEAVAM